VIVLAGCGSGSSSSSSSTSGSSKSTDLTIKVSGAAPKHVTCPGSSECPRLEKTTVDDFAPVPGDVACSQIYGGDATARVEGKLNGDTVNADFNLHNGCEIERWNKLHWLLGKPPSG